MKHKIKVKVPVEKRGFLGIKKAFMETCTIEVNGKTCLQEAEKGMGEPPVQHRGNDIL